MGVGALAVLLSAACSTDGPHSDNAPEAPGRTQESALAGSAVADAPAPVASAAPMLHPEVVDGLANNDTLRVLVEYGDPHPPTPASGSLDASPQRLDDDALVRVAADRAAVREKLLAELAAAGHAVDDARRYDSFPLIALTVTPALLEELAKRSDVVGVYPNRRSELLADSSAPYTGAPTLWASGGTGAGTSVAILDTPVLLNNGAFGNCSTLGTPACAIDVRIDFAFSDGGSSDPRINTLASLEPHGSNVAGIVRAVAPDTRLLSLNVFTYESNGSGGYDIYTYTELEAAALDWVATNAASRSIVAANMSLGSDPLTNVPCNGDALYSVFANLVGTYGVVPVVSSGNAGSRTGIASPACISPAVSVAASYDRDVNNDAARPDGFYEPRGGVPSEIASFSDLSGMIDLAAPGIWVTAGGFADYSGTSMAAPHVAGAIAAAQDAYRDRNGSFRSGYVMSRILTYTANASVRDGTWFPHLQLAEPSDWTWGQLFPSFWGRESEPTIPRTSSLTYSLTISGAPTSVSGLYLPIEVIHRQPQDIEVTVTAPDARTVTFRLPATGFSNFNDVIGRRWLAGTLSGLAGGNPNGTWRISLRDRGAIGNGRYVSAALLFMAAECTPACLGGGCGDDGCGGTCGTCGAGSFCHPDGTCRPSGSWCDGDTSAAPTRVTLQHGVNVVPLDLRECRSHANPSCGGRDSRDRFFELALLEPSALRLQATGFDSVLSASTTAGAGLGCNDNRTAGVTDAQLDVANTSGTIRVAVDASANNNAGAGELVARVCYPSVCNDGLFCNGSERCSGVGCVPGTSPCPATTLACVDACDETTDRCGVLRDGFCLIDGECVGAGVTRSGTPCQVCDPARSTTAWSNNDGASCDDGLFCNGGGTCSAGACVATSPPCPDVSGLACIGACDETNDRCGVLLPGFCLIDGECVGTGERSTLNPCDTCRPSISSSTWTRNVTDCELPPLPDAGSDTDADSDTDAGSDTDADSDTDAGSDTDAADTTDSADDTTEDTDGDAADDTTEDTDGDAADTTDAADDTTEDASVDTTDDVVDTSDDTDGDAADDASTDDSPDAASSIDIGLTDAGGSGGGDIALIDGDVDASAPRSGCSAAPTAFSLLPVASALLLVYPTRRRRRAGTSRTTGCRNSARENA